MNTIKKGMYIFVGFVSLALGLIGVIMPVLPTTPFLLLTSFCFVRGSERFDTWFKGTKIYKKHLESFVQNRAMTLKQKITILLFADFMLAFPLVLVDNLHVRLLIIAVIIGKFYYFFFRIDTIKENGRRINKEKEIVELMINLYCNKKHNHKDGLCEECDELLQYAHKRLSFCKFGDEKSSCSKCPIHCYKKDMKEKIKEVMRFSGPRLIIYRPYEFIRHIFK